MISALAFGLEAQLPVSIRSSQILIVDLSRLFATQCLLPSGSQHSPLELLSFSSLLSHRFSEFREFVELLLVELIWIQDQLIQNVLLDLANDFLVDC